MDTAERTALIIRDQRIANGRNLGYRLKDVGQDIVIEPNQTIECGTDYHVEDDVYIKGHLIGNIRTSKKITIANGGSITGNVVCHQLVIESSGTLTGNLDVNSVIVHEYGYLHSEMVNAEGIMVYGEANILYLDIKDIIVKNSGHVTSDNIHCHNLMACDMAFVKAETIEIRDALRRKDSAKISAIITVLNGDPS